MMIGILVEYRVTPNTYPFVFIIKISMKSRMRGNYANKSCALEDFLIKTKPRGL